MKRVASLDLYVPFPQYFHVPSLSAHRGSDFLLQHKSLPPNKVRGRWAKESGEKQKKKAKRQGCENTQGEQFYGSMLTEVIWKRILYSWRAERDRRKLKAKGRGMCHCKTDAPSLLPGRCLNKDGEVKFAHGKVITYSTHNAEMHMTSLQEDTTSIDNHIFNANIQRAMLRVVFILSIKQIEKGRSIICAGHQRPKKALRAIIWMSGML